jgi:glyoxylase-like metal-dependent hydrolase (beta-lactamase superfamily II)
MALGGVRAVFLSHLHFDHFSGAAGSVVTRLPPSW